MFQCNYHWNMSGIFPRHDLNYCRNPCSSATTIETINSLVGNNEESSRNPCSSATTIETAFSAISLNNRQLSSIIWDYSAFTVNNMVVSWVNRTLFLYPTVATSWVTKPLDSDNPRWHESNQFNSCANTSHLNINSCGLKLAWIQCHSIAMPKLQHFTMNEECCTRWIPSAE